MKYIFENIIKNIALMTGLIAIYPPLKSEILTSSLSAEPMFAGDVLVAVSILAVTACFGNFSFTYEKINASDWKSRLLAHLATGILMLLIGISLEMVSVLNGVIMGNFIFLNISLLLLYTGSVLYDFWDLLRIKNM